MNKRIDLLYSLLHIPIDMAAITGAFILSYWIRGNGLEIYRLPYGEYLELVYAAVPLWIVIFALEGLYRSRHLFGTLQNISRVATAVLAGWATFIVFLTFLKTEETFVFPRLMLVYILIFGFLFVFGGRVLLRIIQLLARTLGIGRRRIMLFGGGDSVDSIEKTLHSYHDVGINFIKHVSSATPKELGRELQKYSIDELIIDNKSISDSEILNYIREAQKCGVTCHLIPNTFEVTASNLLFSTLAGIPLLTFRQTPLEGWGRIAKRFIDIILSLFGLIILSPFFLIIAFIMKLTDPSGPVFYTHKRISRGNKKIRIYKFRTMLAKYCAGPGFSGKTELEIFKELGREDLIEEFKRDHKVKNDPRISLVGNFLRKTNLDELPQLINVLKGDLSLVGPRPIVDAELEKYGHWASYLLSIKPGMTGLWQVSGRNDISYDERVQLDIQYVQNWSLGHDFLIMIKTVLYMVLGASRGY